MSRLVIKVGVDPEFFLVNKNTNTLVSAHGLIPGTKEQPHPLKFGACQLDGTAVEFNTKPASTAKAFVRNNTRVLSQIRRIIPKEFEFVYEPAVQFDKFYFDRVLPEDQKKLGCTPDFNAWSGLMNATPTPPKGRDTLRTGSGHIHIGWTKGKDVTDRSHIWDCQNLVKALDWYVGPYLKFFDNDTDRQSLYGNWGAHRVKPYGVEWRVPSNKWLAHKELWEWLFEAVVFITRQFAEGKIAFGHMNMSSNQYVRTKNREDLNKMISVKMPGFPKMPEFEGDLSQGKKEKKPKAVPIGIIEQRGAPRKGVRVAASAAHAYYDLDLDLPPGGREYTTPGSVSADGIYIDEDDDF